MARYFDPPEAYAPGLTFQLRKKLEGGELLTHVRQTPVPDLYARTETVVLIHGFNNHYGEAGTAYYSFRFRQYERANPQLVPPALEKILADLFWPGDAAWGLFDLLDFLVYPTAVGTAKSAARPLADHLRSMPNLRIVHFVAHSLGCRLALETIDNLRQEGGPTVGRVCLMAAAVPVFKVRPGGSLAQAMEHAGAVRILYSSDDSVLRYAFPPGQTLAGSDEGVFPVALGLHRPPPGIAGRIDPVVIDSAGHSDYWGDSGRPPASLAADRIAEFFRFGSQERTIAERTSGAAPRTAGADAREMGYARTFRSTP